ncbi:MAG: hypothetical protein ACJ73S_10585 [Mycobacteriales bacterium]
MRRRWLLLAGALGVGAAALRRSRAAGGRDEHADGAGRDGVKEVGRLVAAAPARLAPVAKRALEVAGGTATMVRSRLRGRSVGDSPATGEPAEPVAAAAEGEAAKASATAEGPTAEGPTAEGPTAEGPAGEAGTGDASTPPE